MSLCAACSSVLQGHKLPLDPVRDGNSYDHHRSVASFVAAVDDKCHICWKTFRNLSAQIQDTLRSWASGVAPSTIWSEDTCYSTGTNNRLRESTFGELLESGLNTRINNRDASEHSDYFEPRVPFTTLRCGSDVDMKDGRPYILAVHAITSLAMGSGGRFVRYPNINEDAFLSFWDILNEEMVERSRQMFIPTTGTTGLFNSPFILIYLDN